MTEEHTLSPDPVGQLQRVRGVEREAMVIEAITALFNSFVTDENDWNGATLADYRRWMAAIKGTLETLSFSIASARAYAGHADGLEEKSAVLERQIESEIREMTRLENRKATLEEDLMRCEEKRAALLDRIALVRKDADAIRLEAKARQKQQVEQEYDRDRLQESLDRVRESISLTSDTIREIEEDIQKEAERLEEAEARKGACEKEKLGVQVELGLARCDIETVEKEVAVLQALKGLVEFRESIRVAFDEDAIHALANSDLAANVHAHQEELKSLSVSIKRDLEREDQLLSDSLGLHQAQWEALRKQVNG